MKGIQVLAGKYSAQVSVAPVMRGTECEPIRTPALIFDFCSITITFKRSSNTIIFRRNLETLFLCVDTRTTQWEDPRLSNPQIAGPAVPYSRDYKRKYEYLKSQLRKPVSP